MDEENHTIYDFKSNVCVDLESKYFGGGEIQRTRWSAFVIQRFLITYNLDLNIFG